MEVSKGDLRIQKTREKAEIKKRRAESKGPPRTRESASNPAQADPGTLGQRSCKSDMGYQSLLLRDKLPQTQRHKTAPI